MATALNYRSNQLSKGRADGSGKAAAIWRLSGQRSAKPSPQEGEKKRREEHQFAVQTAAAVKEELPAPTADPLPPPTSRPLPPEPPTMCRQWDLLPPSFTRKGPRALLLQIHTFGSPRQNKSPTRILQKAGNAIFRPGERPVFIDDVTDQHTCGYRACAATVALSYGRTNEEMAGVKECLTYAPDSPVGDRRSPPLSPRGSDRPPGAQGFDGTPGDEVPCGQWRQKRAENCNICLGELTPSTKHQVLIDVNDFNHRHVIKPYNGQQRWDARHVKMPNSHFSTYKKSSVLSGDRARVRWDAIEKRLTELAKGSPSVMNVESAIKAYNPQYKDQWNFEALYTYFDRLPKEQDVFSCVIAKMADLALKLPRYVTTAIPLLQQGVGCAITLSQMQIACLLANAFYCTFPHRNNSKPGTEYCNYPTINFSSLFADRAPTTTEKLRAIFHYFKTVTDEDTKPRGLVTFERCFIQDRKLPPWTTQTMTFTKLHATSEGTIEKDGRGMLQVDFACNMVGGGVLGHGLVQEEILFLIHPELIVARLFTEKLNDNECLKITGVQQYSLYSGYSRNFEWVGPYQDNTSRDEWKRLHRQIVAIDALNLKRTEDQYTERNIKRELNKAYCGFVDTHNANTLPAIATGNWGCGAFHGESKLKALIQMMAAAAAGRDMVFFTFGDRKLEKDLMKLHQNLTEQKSTVAKIYETLKSYCLIKRGHDPQLDLFKFLDVPSSSL
ncbi:poly(ADP-ribose) glycohydrolase [Denticeps clupeoides]|uniref:poly(ADP-ribose) glycohydrolase n=1 Tax=Denticeps clupeoides TaxID=299321 RepID=UPI0010A2DC85|nr:poly(ADP-ribose) glycohydrolase-like [Denticeps clupeoides]